MFSREARKLEKTTVMNVITIPMQADITRLLIVTVQVNWKPKLSKPWFSAAIKPIANSSPSTTPTTAAPML